MTQCVHHKVYISAWSWLELLLLLLTELLGLI